MAEFRHETDRLILRDWREEDWPFFWEATNTPAVMRWLGGVCDADKREGAQQRLLSYERDHGHTFWVIERKSDGAILGFCGLKRSNQQGGPIGMMEVGWRLREDAWGQGYAREAATAASSSPTDEDAAAVSWSVVHARSNSGRSLLYEARTKVKAALRWPTKRTRPYPTRRSPSWNRDGGLDGYATLLAPLPS